jgi:hypothetical protein
MNQMLINVSTRRFKRSVRLPEGDVPAPDGAGLSKSATSRRFVALSTARMKAWMETRLDDLDLPAIQIDGIHMDEDMLPNRRGCVMRNDRFENFNRQRESVPCRSRRNRIRLKGESNTTHVERLISPCAGAARPSASRRLAEA